MQSDWSQNDETADDYIKNRPFYSMAEMSTILEDTSLTFSSEMANIDADLSLNIRNKYAVVWNGTEYLCVGQAYESFGVALGNLIYLGASDKDTGEPFVIVWVYPEMQEDVGVKTVVFNFSDDADVTVSILGENIKKLDIKYIPDEVFDYTNEAFEYANAYIGEAFTYTDEQVAAIEHPNEITVYKTTIGTTWEDDEATGVKTQTVPVSGVSKTDTAMIDCVYDGDYTAESYATFAEQKDQYLTNITDGFSETVDDGIKFTIFGDANTVDIPILVEAIHHEVIIPYLTFSAPETFSISVASPGWDGIMEYSTDKTTWSEWDGSEVSGEKIYLRGTSNTTVTGSAGSSYKWTLTGSDIACTGNIETLLDYQTVSNGEHPTMAGYCYASMFEGCTGLTTAPELPATTLAYDCYEYMFRDCYNLTTAPELPATTLASWCYYGMFQGCTGLTTAPELPATTLANKCYGFMFEGCTNLTTAPALPATTLKNYCYSRMFWHCTNLTTAPELPATTLASWCYQDMFAGCTSLTTAPALPATTLANNCYDNMFRDCTSLITAPGLPATTMAKGCYWAMFYGCTSLTTAPALPATTMAEGCYWGMFEGCTSLTTAPELPATTLADECYSEMFEGCTGLKFSATQTEEYTQEYRIPTYGEGITATNALTDMFTSTGGTFAGTPEINTTYYLHESCSIV